jgi:hypothetical protein
MAARKVIHQDYGIRGFSGLFWLDWFSTILKGSISFLIVLML